MKRLTVSVAALSLAFAGLVVGGVPASAARSASSSAATEIGVTTSTIRIAVVADVENPFAPSLFQGGVNGVKAAARFINDHGGVAGRKLEVDFIDSQLNAAQTRNAIITACANDFALVGTAAAFLTSIDDEVNCKDKSGQATGLPDFAAFVTGVQQCSPLAFPVNPPALVCSTKGDHPQTYQGSNGASKFFQRVAGKKKLHGLYLASSDSAVAQRLQDVLLSFPLHSGLASDQHPYVSGKAQQSAFTPIVQKMKADKSNFALSAMGSGTVIELRSEATLQGLTDPNLMWICISCYDHTFAAAGPVVEGTYEPLGILPFEEKKTNKNLTALVKYVGDGKLDQFSIYGFASTLLFKQALEDVVAKHGDNGVTRANVLAAVKGITSFNAGGMIGTNNIAERKTGACFLVMQVKNGKWVRAYPNQPGTFDCNPKNAMTLQIDQPTG